VTISKDDVFHAASALRKQGISPTNRNVREKLGGGSFKTLTPWLREWRGLQELADDIPVELSGVMDTAIRQLWAQAKSGALLAHQGEASALKKRLAELTEEVELRDEMIDRLTEQLAQAEEAKSSGDELRNEYADQMEDLRTQLREAHSQAMQYRQIASQSELAAAETADNRLTEIKRAYLTTARNLRNQIAAAHGILEDARAHERHLNGQIIKLTTELAEAKNASAQ
jgi:chromosome segregation ATPase